MIATKQAQDMLDKATQDANDIRTGAVAYTDELLRSVQEVLVHSMDTTRTRSEQFLNQMQGYLDVVTKNRMELVPAAEEAIPDVPETAAPAGPFKESLDEKKEEEAPSLDVPEDFFKKE